MNFHEREAQIEKRAAAWAVRLDGDTLSPEERADLEAWLDEDPSHRWYLGRFQRLSEDLDRALPELALAGALAEPSTRPSAAPYAALVALAAAAAAAVFLLPFRPNGANRMSTPAGEEKTVTLADGSQAYLNARTNLFLDFQGRQRHVRLTSGEAMFAVTKDPSRPFIVETPLGTVQVTGTVFDVRTDAGGKLDVSVLEGSVLVRPNLPEAAAAAPSAPAPFRLKAGDQLLFDPAVAPPQVRRPAEIENTVAWRSGSIILNGVPLVEAAERFAYFHGQSISVDPAVAHLRLGGRFDLKDLDGFLAAVAKALPVSATRSADGAIILRPAEAP